ncbi:MAG: hypothetical protein MJ210_00450 [Alphaproteobacteria bacterium]|nr:hypothetical protein [Alphaproteobacteria bacterium]
MKNFHIMKRMISISAFLICLFAGNSPVKAAEAEDMTLRLISEEDAKEMIANKKLDEEDQEILEEIMEYMNKNKKLVRDNKEMTQKIEEMWGESDETDESPEETTKKTKDLFSTAGLSNMEVKNKKDDISDKIKGKLTADIATNTERMSKNKKNEEEAKRQSGVSATLNGESESVQVIVENISNQLDKLYDYLDNELSNIQLAAFSLLYEAEGKMPEDRKSSIIDLCVYSKNGCFEGGSVGNLINSAKDTAENVKSKVTAAKKDIEDAKKAAAYVAEATTAVESAVSDSVMRTAKSGFEGML